MGSSMTRLAVTFWTAGTVSALASQPTSTAEIMREKLDRAQELLGAIALNELEAAEEHARELHRLAELQSWYVLPTPEYAEHSQGFREAALAVAEAAEEGDGPRAVDAYGALVRKCVDCHEYLRRVRGADHPEAALHRDRRSGLR